ncbi:MAG: DNA-methyltransferase [Promethearchaeota archaeon]
MVINIVRKNKYIPNLAEFYFKPDNDWSIEKAHALYQKSATKLKDKPIDQIFYQDCISGMQNLPNSCVDLIIADPPFGLNFNGKEALYNRNADFVVDGYKETHIDNYQEFSEKWISELPRLLKAHGSAYIFSGWTNLFPILQAIKKSGLIIRNHIIWEYNFAVFTKHKYASSHYHILYLVKDESKVYFNRIQHYKTDVWRIPRKYQPNQNKNGTKLPLDLVRQCINYSSKPGDLILDPFTGNATTQVAAKGEFRHFLGFELNNQLQKIIESNLKGINDGEYYLPYQDRLPNLSELADKYPKAYKIYIQKEKK